MVAIPTCTCEQPMYLLTFVNSVRRARGYEEIGALPPASNWKAQLELAIGCRLEDGVIRLPSAAEAHAVAWATGLPIGFDGASVALPVPLDAARQGPAVHAPLAAC